MKILVTVKVIFDPEIELRHENDMLCFKNIRRIISPVDEESIMAASEFKKRLPGTKLLVAFIGDRIDRNVFKYTLAMGIDDAFIITPIKCSSKELGDLTIAKELRNFVINNKIDLILTGRTIFNHNTGYIGSALASLLGWTQLYFVYKLLDFKDNKLTLQCYAFGRRMTVIIELPCVLICNFSNYIRYIDLSGIITVFKKQVKIIPSPRLNKVTNSYVVIRESLLSVRTRKCKFLYNTDDLMNTLFN
ncbi:Electron transfer flavoprotein small subunit [Candidatus Hodgkinia cicadicola]|uniref:Electron transfer flavoprotein small subunit n=1 Tax=Candidatus Hodgkinia cicadicola TaxID=573658 RepID=A0ABX4MGN2_9HYPH|nr:Electron transfer flavoprotein small subunit [Candidatus Hodgkinia cicadicola]